MLVGMAKNPSYYNPADSNKRERVRLRIRNVVLNQIGKIWLPLMKKICDSLKNNPH